VITEVVLAERPSSIRGLWWNWAIPGMLFLVAALLAWLFVVKLGIGATRKSMDELAAETPA
jgi:hypothetical protein